MEMILETKNLEKRYRSVCAVDKVSLSIQRGDIFGFVGANGAGKTTFMRMVCGLVRPTGGEMKLFGASSEKELQQKRKKMGALIEHPAIYTNLSAYQNLDIQRRYLDMDSGKNGKEVKKTLTELLDLVGLADVGDRKAGKFSLGMRQRLGIACAIMESPGLLVLDEPFNGLDQEGCRLIRDIIIGRRQEGCLILLACHDREELETLSDRIYRVEGGVFTPAGAAPASASASELP